jgi:serine/threonine protein kinase
MPPPQPDPNGRPSSVKRAPEEGASLPSGDAPAGGPESGAVGAVSDKASTNSHHPAPNAKPNPLADILNATGSSRRVTGGSDILQVLSDPGPAPIPGAPVGNPENTDDAPTVITQTRTTNPGPLPPAPTPSPQHATGDPPAVAGRRLGNYELIEAVGAGGMAAVLKARDLELGRIVALKILPPESARDPENVNRFKQEARAAAKLDHDNVARVYACGDDQGLHFIAFEFVEGINLRQMIDRRGTIPPIDCVRFMIQIAAGLNHAAERGVVHRDIKPSNIVITPDGRAKIVDMGLARQLEAGSVNGELTHSGVTLGTFDYISPEQALDPRRADVRSDIYSLGCAFYHALTGRPPVPEGTAAKKLHAHQYTEPLDPRQINPSIPDELAAILARMMVKDPARRYQTPTELIAHLKGLVERLRLSPDLIGQDSAVQAVPASSSILPRPPRLQMGWVLAAAAVVVAVAAFAMSTGEFGPSPVAPPWGPQKPSEQPDTPHLPGTGTGQTAPADEVVRTPEALASKLGDPETKRVQLAPGFFDLTKLPAAIVFRGTSLELVGSVTPPTVLRVRYGYAGPNITPPAGSLSVIGAETLMVSGIRFEAAREADQGFAIGAALTAADVPQIVLTDCVFSAESTRRSGAVMVSREGARVRAERCVFAPAAFAMCVEDRCEVTVTDCGFGPHFSAIQIGDTPRMVLPEPKQQDVKIHLERSSFLLDPDSAVVSNPYPERGETGVEVTAAYCVFAPVPGPQAVGPPALFPGGTLRRPVLIRAQNRPGDIHFTGERKNAYYGVAALSTPDGFGTKYLTFEQCKTDNMKIKDETATILTHRPWEATDPLAVLTTDPWRAFQLNLKDPDVFTPESSPRDAPKVIGAQFDDPNGRTRWRAYPELLGGFPPIPKSPVPDKRTLVWYPKAPEDAVLPKDTYPDLAFLLTKARNGDEILIHHDGPLPVERVEIKPRAGADTSAAFRVTFKPDIGCQPVLTAAGDEKLNQTLFLVHSGMARFEGLQFLLKPSRPKNAQRVAGAQLAVGAEGCSFADCVFTLAEEDAGAVAAVLVDDPDAVMTMVASGNKPAPKVKFERCVIRGKGRAVWVPVSRAVEVEATQSLLAIDGPIYLGEAGGKASGAKSSMKLNRVTAFLGGPIVELHGGKVGEMRASGLVPLEVHTDECLFAAVPGAGRSLVEFEGIDPAEAMKILPWSVEHANRYANFPDGFAAMLVRPATENTTPKELSWDQWISQVGEKDGKPVGKVTFENAPSGLEKLASLSSADAVIKMVEFPDLTGAKITDAGADTKTLPSQAGEP